MRKLIAAYHSKEDTHIILNMWVSISVTCFLFESNGLNTVECTVHILQRKVNALGDYIVFADSIYDAEIERHLYHRYSNLLVGNPNVGTDREFTGDIIRVDNV